MSKKISINPDFFKLSGKKSKKSKKEKPKFTSKSLKPNDIKKKLIAKIKAHQKKEKEKIELENIKSNEAFQDDFKETINYLEEMKKKRSIKKKKKNKTLKKRKKNKKFSESHNNDNYKNVASGLQIHLESMDDAIKKDDNTLKVAADPPYGCLKNGSKPTWRQYNKTLKKTTTFNDNNINKNNTNQNATKNEFIPLSDLKFDLPKHNEFLERQNKLKQLKDSLQKPKPIKKKIKTKRIRRKITLGKKGGVVGVLVKSKKTRKIIKSEVNILQKKSIHEIKDYLRKHNLIKIGTNAPDYILRSIYENAYLSGDVKNKNADVLLHNWHKENDI